LGLYPLGVPSGFLSEARDLMKFHRAEGNQTLGVVFISVPHEIADPELKSLAFQQDQSKKNTGELSDIIFLTN
jgi:hypothetical protein